MPTTRWGTATAFATMMTAVTPAHATYTIVGTDSATRQAGGAAASCPTGGSGGYSVYIAHASRPGVGVVHALGAPNVPGRDRALDMLAMGSTPAEALAAIKMGDSQLALRIYGIADVKGQMVGFFGGSPTISPGGDKQGMVGSYVYSVQGGIITDGLLDNAAAAFQTKGCDLADKLMLALEGGALNNGGDTRCTTKFMTPGETGFLQVDDPSVPSGSYLKLVIDGLKQPDDPVKKIRGMFDEWRKTHPCGSGGGSDAGVDAPLGAGGSGGGGGSGGSGGPADAGLDTGGAGGGTGGTGGGSDSGAAGSGGKDGSIDGPAARGATEGSGCACGVTSAGGPSVWLAAALLALLLCLARAGRRRN